MPPLYQPPGSIGENVDSQNQIRGGMSSDAFPEILGVPIKQGNHGEPNGSREQFARMHQHRYQRPDQRGYCGDTPYRIIRPVLGSDVTHDKASQEVFFYDGHNEYQAEPTQC